VLYWQYQIEYYSSEKVKVNVLMSFSIIIIVHKFYRDASLEQNFRAAVCHVLH